MAIIALLCVGTVFTLDIKDPAKAARAQQEQAAKGQQNGQQQQQGTAPAQPGSGK
jgi:hypothetical protein